MVIGVVNHRKLTLGQRYQLHKTKSPPHPAKVEPAGEAAVARWEENLSCTFFSRSKAVQQGAEIHLPRNAKFRTVRPVRLIAGRLPPTDGTDRFHFPVTPQVTLHAPDKEELIRRIFEYRLRQNIPPGDIEADVNRYYCARYPRFCTSEPNDLDPTKPRVSGETMLNRVSRWAALMIHKMPRGGFPLVTSAEAENRAAICINCAKNIHWRGHCGGCSASTLQLVQQIKSLRKTKRDGNLSACSVTSAENSSSVWIGLADNPLSDEQSNQLPVHCWRK